MSTLTETLEAIRGVEGWMTDDQAETLWNSAAGLPPDATIVEIGSFRGRSTIVLARATAGRSRVIAIDPHAGNDRGPQEIEADGARGQSDNEVFNANLRAAGVDGQVRHVRLPSEAALGEVDGDLDVLYVDGAHRYSPARDDIERWGGRVRHGGTLLIHDSFSSVGVTLAQMRLLFLGDRFHYLGRAGSMARYRREDLGPRERLANARRQAAALPWFVRNLVVKVAIVTGLTPLARALGHRDGPWPY